MLYLCWLVVFQIEEIRSKGNGIKDINRSIKAYVNFTPHKEMPKATEFSSVQDGIYALHPISQKLPSVTFETVPMFV